MPPRTTSSFPFSGKYLMPSVESLALLASNHDLHLHSRYSDGWHSVEEVTGFALRWLEADRWVGLSDHSPFLPEVIRNCMPAGTARARDVLARQILRSSPVGHPPVQRAIDDGVRAYIRAAGEDRPRVRALHKANLLIGLEVEWCLDGPAVSPDVLDELDYVIAGYHGRGLRDPTEAEEFLHRVIRHPHTDVIAHPDRFLGPFDVLRCDWDALFEEMARRHVLCEYNLTTPLRDELLTLALAVPDLQFVIGSDTHDFRRRCHRRVMDAWAESAAGRFRLAREFLDRFLLRDQDKGEPMRELYRSPGDLAALEGRVWRRTRRVDPSDELLSPREQDFLELLDRDASDTLDREFLAARLTRFTAIPSRRLASLLPENELRALVRRNRSLRCERVGALSEALP